MSSFAAASADESTRVTGKQKHMPWVEKYRPERVEDVSHQDEVIKTLKSAIDQGSVPHLLFYGPPGTGIDISDTLLFDVLIVFPIRQNHYCSCLGSRPVRTRPVQVSHLGVKCL